MAINRLEVIAIAALAVMGCHDTPPAPPPVMLTAAQRARAHALVAAARQRIDAAEARRNAAFAAAPTAVQLGAAPCPLGRAELGAPADMLPNERTVKLLGMTRVIYRGEQQPTLSVTASRLADLPPYRMQQLDRELDPGSTADQWLAELGHELDAYTSPSIELALVLDQFANAKQIDTKSFAGGGTRGTLYVWSEDKGAIVCAAPAAGESADHVQVTVHGTVPGIKPTQEEVDTTVAAHLTGELLVDTIDQAISRLHAVSPT